MADDRLYGFDERSFSRVREATMRVLGRPRRGTPFRRQPPVLSGGGAVAVVGPCGTYTPDEELDDTDFEYEYPDGCVGPSRIGVVLIDPSSLTVTDTYNAEIVDTAPLTFQTDNFSITCLSGSIGVYVKVVMTGLGVGGVTLTVYKASDDSVIDSYRNAMWAYYPLSGGYLNLGTDPPQCICGTLPYDFCIAIPTR